MEDIKNSIILNVDQLLTINFNIFKEKNTISPCELTKEITKIINNQIKNIKNKKKINENDNENKLQINSREELTIIYKEFMKKRIHELKIENENHKYKKSILDIFSQSYNEWKIKEKEIFIKEK